MRRDQRGKAGFCLGALRAPKQERWMAVHEDRVQALMVGVGAAFDYEAGNIRRAPMWMQRHNLNGSTALCRTRSGCSSGIL